MRNIFIIVTAALVFVGGKSSAQFGIVNDELIRTGIKNNTLVEKYANIEGNPYFFKDWVKGKITISKGVVDTTSLLKFDQVENKLFVKGDAEDVYTFKEVVAKFTLVGEKSTHNFECGFPKTADTDEFTYFEVFNSGKTKIARRTVKVIEEYKPYSGAMVKQIAENQKYYLCKSGTATIPVKLDKKEILQNLSDKQKEVEDFLSKKKLNLKKIEDVTKLLDYYNSL